MIAGSRLYRAVFGLAVGGLLACLLTPGLCASGLAVTVTLSSTPPPQRLVTAPAGQSATRGSILLYRFRLLNITSTRQRFRLALTAPSRWIAVLPLNLDGRAGPLSAGESTNLYVLLFVPQHANVGATGVLTLRAMGTVGPIVSGQDSVTTTVVSRYGLTMTSDGHQSGGEYDGEQPAHAGDTVRYRAQLTNLSGSRRTFTLSATSLQGWSAAMMGQAASPITLAANRSQVVEARVTVPHSASVGTTDALVISADVTSPALHYEAVGVTTVVHGGGGPHH
jgi:hypothetical protein